MDQDTDSTSEQMDRDNKLSESELDTTSDDNDWCPVTKREQRSTCPIEGCGGKSKHHKHHAWEYHIPRIFWDHPWKGLNNSPDYHKLRASCLDTLSKYILGTGTVQDLVIYVNDKVRLPCKYPIIPRTQHQMGLLTRTMWWSRVEAYEMLPVNSPAILIHWRILLALVGIMTPKNRSDFKSLGREKLLQLEDQVRVHHVPIPVDIEDEWTVIDECGGEDDNYEVVIIQEGYSVPHQDKVKMGSSITLIKGPLNILVDTVNDDVEVIPTPGPTSEDIFVIVKNTQLGTIAVVGDLFHSEEDMEDSSLWRSRSQDPARQEANRHKILRLVDYVVPGHGKIFQTPRK
uniref:Metallo-beta-lactamase domain-containing protein n=1 Tax=Magallana gigas TaxID=29159 RepID=A0A8W8LSG1_MAGGI